MTDEPVFFKAEDFDWDFRRDHSKNYLQQKFADIANAKLEKPPWPSMARRGDAM
jgi:hypothetical protein